MAEMKYPDQGDILRVSGMKVPVAVVSNNFFNRSGKAVVCPIVPIAEDGPLHLSTGESKVSGSVLCEQVHYVDLKVRSFKVISTIPFFNVMDISDAVMGIFDYQTM